MASANKVRLLHRLKPGEKPVRASSVASAHLVAHAQGCRSVLRVAVGKQENVVLDGKELGALGQCCELRFDREARHLFVVAREGKRFCVLRDGVQLGNETASVQDFALSADGEHCAWRSVETKTHLAVHDGNATAFPAIHSLALRPDGTDVAVVVAAGERMFVSVGSKQHERYDHVALLRWASDTRLLYAAREGGRSFVVDNERKGPLFDQLATLEHTADGRAFYLADLGEHRAAVLDGEVLHKGYTIDHLGLSADRQRYGYTLDKSFVVDGKRTMIDGSIVRRCFGPDSKHDFCFVTKDGALQVFRDGVCVSVLRDVYLPSVLVGAEGHYACLRRVQNDYFVVLDGTQSKESYKNATRLVFSPGGERLAFAVSNGIESAWVVDGVRGPSGAYRSELEHSFRFSADGANFAYCVERNEGARQALAVNHKPGEFFDELLDFCWSAADDSFVALARKGKEYFLVQARW